MKITYRCPNCQTKIGLVLALVGEQVDCPKCTVPFLAKAPSAEPLLNEDSSSAEFAIDKPTDDESVILETHPAMFRRHPIQFVLLSIISLASLIFAIAMAVNQIWGGTIAGVVAMLLVAAYFGYWYLEVIATQLVITNKRTTLRHGILAKKTSEVQHDDIRNLQVEQNAIQRIFGIGTIAISSSGQDDVEVTVKGIPNPNEVAELVRRMQ